MSALGWVIRQMRFLETTLEIYSGTQLAPTAVQSDRIRYTHGDLNTLKGLHASYADNHYCA